MSHPQMRMPNQRMPRMIPPGAQMGNMGAQAMMAQQNPTAQAAMMNMNRQPTPNQQPMTMQPSQQQPNPMSPAAAGYNQQPGQAAAGMTTTVQPGQQSQMQNAINNQNNLQQQPEQPSPQPARSRNIFDELLEGFEDVFARLIAKDEMLGRTSF